MLLLGEIRNSNSRQVKRGNEAEERVSSSNGPLDPPTAKFLARCPRRSHINKGRDKHLMLRRDYLGLLASRCISC